MENMSQEHYPVENMIEDLKEIIEELKAKTFTGCIVYSCCEKEKAWAQMVKGDARDRLVLVDAGIMSMHYDPVEKSRNWFFSEIYERFKMLRPSSLVEADRAIA